MATKAPYVLLCQFVVFSLVALVLSLTAAAHASPPDQSWISGLYDNADFDEIVLFITGELGAIQPSIVWSLRPSSAVVGLVKPMDELRSVRQLSSSLGRAPPRVQTTDIILSIIRPAFRSVRSLKMYALSHDAFLLAVSTPSAREDLNSPHVVADR